MEEIVFDTTKGVVSIVKSSGWDTYFVHLDRVKVGSVSLYPDGWKFIHAKDVSVFSEKEALILVDISLGKTLPKSIIVPIPILVGGKSFIVKKCASNKFTITKPSGVYDGDLVLISVNGHKRWSSNQYAPEIAAEIGRQLLGHFKN